MFPETTTTFLNDIPDPSIEHMPVTVSFQVTHPSISIIPTGTVTISVDQGTEFCIDALSGGLGSCEITINNPGNYTLIATYSGDDNFVGSVDNEAHVVLTNLFLPLIMK